MINKVQQIQINVPEISDRYASCVVVGGKQPDSDLNNNLFDTIEAVVNGYNRLPIGVAEDWLRSLVRIANDTQVKAGYIHAHASDEEYKSYLNDMVFAVEGVHGKWDE